jgi:ferredoxin-fold anticodon binding domain-containing protein
VEPENSLKLIILSKDLEIKVWKKFKIDNTVEALQALFTKERDGRILLDLI